MKSTTTTLFLVALLTLSLPTVQAEAGTVCNERGTPVTGGGNPVIFEVHRCGPSSAQVGSIFEVDISAQLSVSGLVLTLPAANTWSYIGCTYAATLSTNAAVLTVSSRATVTMTTPTCSISTVVSVGPLIGAGLAAFPVSIHVYDPTATLPTSFNNNITGQLDVDVLTWPQLNASITEWPTLFNSVNITDWPELFATINGDLALDIANLTVSIAEWPTLFNSVNITDWPQLDALVSGQLDLNVTDIPTLELMITQWPELFASVDIDSWPTLFSVLSGTVTVEGVEIDLNTTIESIGNITNEAQTSNLQEATGLDGPDWLPLLFLLLAAILIWHRTKDLVMLNLMGVMALFVGIVLLFVYAAILWPGLLALGLISSVVGGYMILRTNIEEFSKG